MDEVKKKPSKIKKVLLIILAIIIICFVYIRFIATSNFIVKEYAVYSDNLPNNFNGFKIAHLSDIHYASIGKEKLDKIVNEVNITKPDIIVFTGDLYDEYANFTEDMKSKIIESLSKLNAPLGKYAISGNHDYSNDNYEIIIEKCGFTYLNSNSKFIYYNGDDPIEIVGYPSYLKDNPNYDYELSNYFKIALIHEGDAFDNISDKNIDLVLAGHSQGGQIRLPLIGPISLPVGAKKYYDEYYYVNNSKIYISYGLGETKYKVRAFNKPSFNLYRLYKN